MKRALCALLWSGMALPPAAGQQQAAAPLPSAGEQVVVSRSKQFRVSGGNAFGRGLCVILAEDAKDELLQLLEQADDWKIPVTVVLHGEPGDPLPPTPVASRLRVIGGVHQLLLDVHLGEGLRVERFRRAVTEMLLYERALRASAGMDGPQALAVPPWLSVGLREAIAWQQQRSDRRLYASMFKQGSAYEAGDLFAVSPARHAELDEASRVAFRVSAGSMVMALLEQPQGREAFRKFLDQAAAFQGEMALLLRRHFPELNLSSNSLAKWWALQLANQGGLNLLTDVMGVAETEQGLTEALFLELPAAAAEQAPQNRRVGLDEWRLLEEWEPDQRQAAVRPAQAALVHLSYRCFPSYRPLLVEYQKQLVHMAQGGHHSMQAALEQLAEARRIMVAKAERGRDYLDWFEITRARETSGAFDDYLRLKQELQEREDQRRDPLSEYLERMEQLFERGEEK